MAAIFAHLKRCALPVADLALRSTGKPVPEVAMGQIPSRGGALWDNFGTVRS